VEGTDDEPTARRRGYQQPTNDEPTWLIVIVVCGLGGGVTNDEPSRFVVVVVAFVGLHWPSLVCVGPRWRLLAFVGVCWPSSVFVGPRWPLLAVGGLR
jgi:hypothetical protein